MCASLLFLLALLPVVSSLVSPVSEYVRVPEKFIAPIPSHSLKVEKDVSLEMCAAKCTIYFRTRQFPCYAFEYTTGSKMCVYTNMTTLLVKNGYLGLHENRGVDFYERSKVSYKNLFRKIPNSALSEQSSYYHIKQNSSLEECSFHCVISHSHTCMSFSYSHTSGTCGLSNMVYTGQSHGVSLMHTTLYDHYQYFNAWPCNATLASNYAPHAIASLKYPYMAMLDLNCHVTIQAPDDNKITLTFPTVYFKSSVCYQSGSGITVYDGLDEKAPVISRVCAATTNAYTVNSSSSILHIRFQAKQTAMAFQGVYEFNEPEKPRNPCENNNCRNGGTCQPLGLDYNCACVPGFTGVFCETNVDDCASSPCYFGGTCVDGVNDYSCICVKNFTGSRCERYLGMCANNPCIHGICYTTGRQSYACHCDPNFIGKNCDVRFHPCLRAPCKHGSCVDSGNDYRCVCAAGFTGKDCDVQDDNPCTPNPCVRGDCMIYAPNHTYACICESGFTGKLCNYVINHCEGVDCGYGHCVSDQTGYRCLCDNLYDGVDCRRPRLCQSVDCGNGTCVMNHTSPPGVHCMCDQGYDGERCNHKANSCKNSPCVHGSCQDGGYICVCDKGYAGPLCDEEINPCRDADCGYGMCEATANFTYRCICARGFSGPQCKQTATTKVSVTPNPCQNHPCQNGGVCKPRGSGQYVCLCGQTDGVFYSGRHCEESHKYCDSTPCRFGRCVPHHDSYRCVLQGSSNVTAVPISSSPGNISYLLLLTIIRH
ncbi:fibropellin-1-like isoform X2 [Ostrea edulis]|uniref:fibropellin-1-like isoform X2 n=1 Tax=Ostrea edulis TaxID=37623 RepID=UPI0024AEFBAB|nr:fibropellin-1-like isoform X2 [Ostrea edulis]